jgi:hypothetical protein
MAASSGESSSSPSANPTPTPASLLVQPNEAKGEEAEEVAHGHQVVVPFPSLPGEEKPKLKVQLRCKSS